MPITVVTFVPLTDIRRVTSMKILDVTVTDHLSVSEHVRDVTCILVQSMHTFTVLDQILKNWFLNRIPNTCGHLNTFPNTFRGDGTWYFKYQILLHL